MAVFLKQKRPNSVRPPGGIADPAKSQGFARPQYEACAVPYCFCIFFFFFFFVAMAVFLGWCELRQGSFKSRA
jgi:hypothetical protein